MEQNRENFLNNTQPKDERLEKLKTLFPEAFADGKLNIETLKDLCLGAEDSEIEESNFYGLTWNGKRQARRMYKQPASGTLKIAGGDLRG